MDATISGVNRSSPDSGEEACWPTAVEDVGDGVNQPVECRLFGRIDTGIG